MYYVSIKNVRFLVYSVVVFSLLIVPLYFLLPTPYSLVPSAFAFESTSASFEIHAAALDSISGTSTSASFKLNNAGGQTGTGTSTSSSFKDFSGVLYWLHGLFTPQYEQIHYRWRNDDGSEAAATWAQVEDGTYTSFPKTTIKRLRFEITNSGWTRGAAPTFKLQYAKKLTDCTSETYTDVPATATTEHWELADSANFTDGAATTNVAGGLIDANAIFVAGQVKDTGNTTGTITLASNNFTEIEYSVRATITAESSATYCLRLTNSNPKYTKYAQAQIAGYAGQGSVISSTFDTGITSGAAYNSIIWHGTKPAGTYVKIQLATATGTGGPWNYYGPAAACDGTTFYEPASGVATEIGCPAQHNNHRYFKYKIQLCSTVDCSTGGTSTPQVDDIIVNWSP